MHLTLNKISLSVGDCQLLLREGLIGCDDPRSSSKNSYKRIRDPRVSQVRALHTPANCPTPTLGSEQYWTCRLQVSCFRYVNEFHGGDLCVILVIDEFLGRMSLRHAESTQEFAWFITLCQAPEGL